MIAHRLASIMLVGALALPGLVWADGEPFKEYRMQETRPMATVPQGRGDGFAWLDQDRDGRISRIEAGNRPLSEPFSVLDRNRDGFLTIHEYRYRSH